jgi:peroxiredoxin (alkyl hydroperoxide reductase subunit C)
MIADIKRELSQQLGVLDKQEGVALRATFVVDPQGVLRKVYTQVKPDGHERQVLADLTQLQQAAAR